MRVRSAGIARRAASASLALLTLCAVGTSAGAASTCSQPYAPVFAFYAAPSSPGVVMGVQPVSAMSLNAAPPPLDTDGDGVPDDVVPANPSGPSDSTTIRRTDGDVVLTAGTGHVGFVAALGDLDADGRIDFSVLTDAESTSSPRAFDTDVVVSAPPAPGTYDIFDIGVTLPAGAAAAVGVGDQDADGFDDAGVLTIQPQTVTSVASGAALLSPGPGGRLSSLPPSIVPLRGAVVAIVNLQESGAPALVESVAAPADAVGLVVHDRGQTTQLQTTMPVVAIDGPAGINRIVTGFLATSGHHIIELHASSREGTSIFDWDLDSPCGTELSAPPAPVQSATSPADVRQEIPRTGQPLDQLLVLGGLAIALGAAVLPLAARRSKWAQQHDSSL